MCSICTSYSNQTQSTQSVRKESVENVRMKNTIVYYLVNFNANYILFQQLSFIFQITFNAISCFLYICQVSSLEYSTRTLLAISLHFQNKPFLDYECDRKIYDFFKQNTESLSTCSRINLIDPVSHQSQIWKINSCLPIFTVNNSCRNNGRLRVGHKTNHKGV